MYNLTVTNNYLWPVTASDGTSIPVGGGSKVFNNQGNIVITIPGMGEINFIDLGQSTIPGYLEPTETWGVLVRYSNIEAYYRYEGQGELSAALDSYGTCKLTTNNGSMIPISLPEFQVESN